MATSPSKLVAILEMVCRANMLTQAS